MFLDTSTATFSVLHIIYIYMIEEILKRENPVQLVVSLDDLRTVIHEIQVEAAQDTSLSKMAQVLPTPNHEDRYLTREEAAEFCHVSKSTIWRWKRDGILQFCRFGHKLLFKMSALEEFMKKYETELL